MAGIIPGEFLGGVVSLLAVTQGSDNLVRRRWSGGTDNPTGEAESRTAADLTFKGLVSSATRNIERGRWGELDPQDLFIRAAVADLGGDINALAVGDVVYWRDRQLEVKQVKPAEIHGEIHYLTARVREVQGDGTK